MPNGKLVQFAGSRGDMWPEPPQDLIDMLDDWLQLAGVKVPHRFWVESSESSDDFIPDPLIRCRITNANFFDVTAYVRNGEKCDFWLLHMAWSSDDIIGLNNSLLDATEFFAHHPTQPGCRVYNRLLSLYEMVSGKDITPNLVTDDLAKDAFFRDGCELIFGLSFLAKRGVFIQACEGNVFRWTDSFRQHMDSLSDDRRDRLLELDELTPEKLANSLSQFQGEMLEKLGTLPGENHAAELEIRISNKFLDLTQVALEEFVGLLAAGGVVTAIADHENGLLGKVWRLNLNQQQEVLKLFKNKWESRRVHKPTLTRGKEIEKNIAINQALFNSSSVLVAEDRDRLDSVKAEIFEMESKLTALRARQATLQANISGSEATLEKARAALAQLEADKVAHDALIANQASEAIAAMKRIAVELNLDPDALLMTVAAKLGNQKIS